MASGARRRLEAFNAAHAHRKLPYYEVLGVSQDATESEIVRAYRKRSLKLHPDKPGGCHEKFQELSKAYKCLKDPASRRKYDDCGFDEDNISTAEVDQFVDAFFGEGARSVDGRSGDWRTNNIENYIRINLEEVPLHMKDIVRIGLNYMVSLDLVLENVVLLQHARVDILYLMVGLLKEGELTQEVFEGEESYTITYYDNPLQPGIAPRWGDQNGKKARKRDMPRRELNFEEFQRRQKHALAMLENAPADPMAALEEKYRAKMLATEHRQAAIAAEKRNQAIRGQDVYEDDAELDVNAFTDMLAQDKQERSEIPSASSVSTAADSLPVHDGDTELEVPSTSTKDTNEMTAYESKGSEKVLDCNSDGILFVASGGKVLRNEGPPRPNEAIQKPDASASQIQCETTKQELVSTAPSFQGCLCLQAFFEVLQGIFRSTFHQK
mmetsp:Transcript_28440/g.51392  ORF Transcript_28440/g.51392 Transcript_28440/m.51392 type:complete len:439 (+) Transcript_28440:55-1371(+)